MLSSQIKHYNFNNLSLKTKNLLKKRINRIMYTKLVWDDMLCSIAATAIFTNKSYLSVRKFFLDKNGKIPDGISTKKLLSVLNKLNVEYRSYYLNHMTWQQQIAHLMSLKQEAIITLESKCEPNWPYSHCVVWEPKSQRFLDGDDFGGHVAIRKPHVDLQYQYNVVHVIIKS